jgi:hypothetical protein
MWIAKQGGMNQEAFFQTKEEAELSLVMGIFENIGEQNLVPRVVEKMLRLYLRGDYERLISDYTLTCSVEEVIESPAVSKEKIDEHLSKRCPVLFSEMMNAEIKDKVI